MPVVPAVSVVPVVPSTGVVSDGIPEVVSVAGVVPVGVVVVVVVVVVPVSTVVSVGNPIVSSSVVSEKISKEYNGSVPSSSSPVSVASGASSVEVVSVVAGP